MSKKKFRDLDEYRKWEIVDSITTLSSWYEHIIESQVNVLLEHGFEDAEIQFSGFYSQGDGASFTCKRINIPLFLRKHWPEMDFQSEQIRRWQERMSLYGETLAGLGFSEDDAGILVPVLHLLFEEHKSLILGSVDRISHRYVHENSVSLNLDLEYYEVVEDPDERDLENQTFTPEDEAELLDFYTYLEGWMERWIKEKNHEIYLELEEEWEAWQKELYDQFEEENEEWQE